MNISRGFARTFGLPLVAMVLLCGSVFGAAPAMAGLSVSRFAFSARNQDGTSDVQAGSHPYAVTSTFMLNEPGPTTGDLKDLRLELPPGFAGNPNATPKCGYQVFVREEEGEELCPNASVVGVATSYVKKANRHGVTPTSSPVFNLVAPKGVPAEFGFMVAQKVPVLLETSVRTGGDYGLTTTVPNVNEGALVAAGKVTIWGVPASPTHNLIRGTCLRQQLGQPVESEEVGSGLREGEDELEGPIGPYEAEEPEPVIEPTLESETTGGCSADGALVPLLTNPVSCGRPRVALVSIDSWEEPGVYRSTSASLPELTGCDALGFSSTISVTPERNTGSTPSGVDASIHIPQESTENPRGLAEADAKDTTLTLPAGLQLNASAADGLQACSIAQIGYTGSKELEPGVEPGVETAQFTPGEASCPNASKLANVRIKTPLLEDELTGAMYLAAPQNFAGLPENPFSSLIAVYLVAEEPKTGVLVKLAGHVELGGEPGVTGLEPGQIRTSFDNTPQVPYSDLHVEFFGGERASLATPAACGSYQSKASFTPWSSTEPTVTSSSFQVTSGPNGTACASSQPFAPAVASQSTNVNAGSFTPLTTAVSKEDGQQNIQSVSLTYPPGVSGVLTGVPLCGEAQANAGSCGAESLIGEATASAGLGGDPYMVTGGRVYLTGPYEGAPFGLSIVTVPKAGPFMLEEGRPIVVRARIEINPVTAALTVSTDASGEHAIPHILDGVPLELKHLYVNINRANFTINPTNCERRTITGSVASAEGALSPVSVPFQVGECGALRFQPEVLVTAGGHSSKKDGENVSFKISYPQGALGSEAWFREAKFVIPKQLPSELKTIQQACPAATFEANPTNCPVHSKIGEAIVHTQVLPVPLTGPVYFVSYGNAQFPDVVMLLSGDNVNIKLTGETYIHEGVTSATFPNTPDVPFESIEVNLPAGEYSEFGTNLGVGNYDFCGQKLKMPTEFQAQNGLQIHQETPVTITGCATAVAIQSSRVRKRTLTLTVYVPGPGKLTATGKGLRTHSRIATGQELITFSITPTKHGRLTTHIALTYTPTTGMKQTTTTKATFRR